MADPIMTVIAVAATTVASAPAGGGDPATIAAALAIAGLLGSGLTGGVVLSFSNFMMRALGDLAPAEGMRAMQRINVRVYNPLFMGGFAATTLVSLAACGIALWDWRPAVSIPLLIAGASYVLGVFLVTGMRNVPLNEELARAEPAEPGDPGDPGVALWSRYLVTWTRWNHVRTVACVVSLGGHALALAAAAGAGAGA